MTPAAARPIVLALAPPAPGLSAGSVTPSLELLGGSRLLERLLRTHAELGLAAPLVVAAPEVVGRVRELLGPSLRVLPAPGGRREALRAALAACEEEQLLIHDAERALTPASVIERVLSALEDGVDAVVPVTALTDSVKEVLPDGLRNIDRTTLAGLQSPRLLRRTVLADALALSPSPSRLSPSPSLQPPAEHPPAAAHAGGSFDEILAALENGARVRTVPGSHSGFAVRDRLTLWQAQISLGLARDTSHRHGLARRS